MKQQDAVAAYSHGVSVDCQILLLFQFVGLVNRGFAGFVAFHFVLRIVFAGLGLVTFDFGIFRHFLHDLAFDLITGVIPFDFIAFFK